LYTTSRITSMHGLHQVLELGDHLLDAPRGVGAVRGEEADRVVAPVIAQALVREVVVVDEVMNRHQLHRGDAEPGEVLDDGGVRHARVRAPLVLGDRRVPHGEALDVALVQHGLVPGGAQRAVVPPFEPRVGDDRPRDERRAVLVVALAVVAAEGVAVDGWIPLDLAVERPGVRVDEQLRRVAAQADVRVMRPVHPVPVALPRPDARQERVPDVAVHLGHLHALLTAARAVQAELDALGLLREQREVGANAVVASPKGVRLPWP
jgi:hypothetical protein